MRETPGEGGTGALGPLHSSIRRSKVADLPQTRGMATGDTAAVLVYDGDCGFCTRTANWLTARGPATAQPAQSLYLPTGDAARTKDQAGWLIGGRIEIWGADAIAAALRARGGVSGLVGILMGQPGVRLIARGIYRMVADNRQHMPGGTAACAIPNKVEPDRGSLPTFGFLAVLLLFLAGLGITLQAAEPYPVIAMPPFGGVPDTGTVIHFPEPRLTVSYDDGGSEAVTGEELLPFNGVAPWAGIQTIFGDEATATDPETVAWLRQLVLDRAPGTAPQKIDVRWVLVDFDRRTKVKTDRRVLNAFTIDLEGQR